MVTLRRWKRYHEFGWTNYQPEKIGPRAVKMENIRNVRGLGGFSCGGGGGGGESGEVLTKEGVFFRCAKVEDANEEDVRVFRDELKIKTVLDLRGMGWGARRALTTDRPMDAAYPWDIGDISATDGTIKDERKVTIHIRFDPDLDPDPGPLLTT